MSHHVRIAIEHDGWQHAAADVTEIVRRAALAALAGRSSGPREIEVSVLLTGDAAVADLNQRYRNREGATNVLSFANGFANGFASGFDGISEDLPLLLGDVVVAYETAAREAAAEGRRLEDHLAHLVVHGLFHLLGFDHEDDGPAQEMESEETMVLGKLGVSDPYGPGAG